MSDSTARSRFRVYQNAPSTTSLLGLRGVARLALDEQSAASTHRTVPACPNVAFYALRVPWLVRHRNLAEGAAQEYARREQALRILHAADDVLACEYSPEDMQRIQRRLGPADDALKLLLAEYIQTEDVYRQAPQYMETDGVFAPYLPTDIDFDNT